MLITVQKKQEAVTIELASGCIRFSDSESVIDIAIENSGAVIEAIEALTEINKDSSSRILTADEFEQQSISSVDDFLNTHSEHLGYLWGWGDGKGGYLINKIASVLLEKRLINEDQIPR